VKNSDGILAIQETLEVVEETIGETPLVTIIVAMEENNALRLTTTIGPVLSARTPILHSAKYAIAVKRLGLAVVEALVITEVAQTVVHNATAVGLTAVTTIVKRFTTITTGPARSVRIPILHSVKYAIAVKPHAQVVVVAVLVTDATAVAEMVTDATVVAKMVTDAITVETVVILVTAIKTNDEATILTIARRRVSDQVMPTTESRTTSNQGSTTDTTTDER
jgi:hypothetical protein